MATTLTPAHIELFRNLLIARGRSEETVRAYAGDVKAFLEANSPVTMEDFDLTATTWLNLMRRSWSPKTMGRRLTALRTFARLMKITVEHLTEYRAPDPGRPVPHPIPEGVPGVLAMAEHAKNERQRALIAFCGLAGLRLNEALSIQVSSFDLNELTLTVRGKGDKTRTIPISTRAWELIGPAASSAVLETGHLNSFIVRYRDRFAREVIRSCGVRALGHPVSPHDLRATFATAAYSKTRNLRAVQEYLGHSNSRTTEVYTGISMDSMREAADLT